jgi:hypothetical protein
VVPNRHARKLWLSSGFEAWDFDRAKSAQHLRSLGAERIMKERWWLHHFASSRPVPSKDAQQHVRRYAQAVIAFNKPDIR